MWFQFLKHASFYFIPREDSNDALIYTAALISMKGIIGIFYAVRIIFP